MKYSSVIPIESKIFPGVSYALRKMSEARRAEFRLKTAEAQSKLRNLNREAQRLLEQGQSDPMGLDTARVEDLNEQILAVVGSEINPAWVRWGLKDITGLEIDEQPATPELLIADGPPELFAEVCAAIISASSMTEAELKNFALPTISGAPMDGTVSNTSVAHVSEEDGSAAETVGSTFQT